MTSAPTHGDFEAALDLFRTQFAEQLPVRLAEAQSALQAWREEPASEERLRILHRVLHRLAGSAGTFGMPRFGEACRAIEQGLDALLERSARTPADVEAIAGEIEALEQALR
ncbi:Hpt domain-containing protein [Ramlibacter sp. USB13]|uniref:Hpt domain-containing protein n=1 Tax=Ramlibacter cellulosilyticus TaxID=2764187 RepID=A0A923MP14_9BURK|nr:Hpt domain-containing protein [Ramlibacter cellulosilyticus]MBC5782241.1 Hpt domain-containing protein [Ramlibacter cellulosilyticus]